MLMLQLSKTPAGLRIPQHPPLASLAQTSQEGIQQMVQLKAPAHSRQAMLVKTPMMKAQTRPALYTRHLAYGICLMACLRRSLMRFPDISLGQTLDQCMVVMHLAMLMSMMSKAVKAMLAAVALKAPGAQHADFHVQAAYATSPELPRSASSSLLCLTLYVCQAAYMAEYMMRPSSSG